MWHPFYYAYTLLKWSLFGPPCKFNELVQRIFNCNNIQDNNVTSEKVLNIFIYMNHHGGYLEFRSYLLPGGGADPTCSRWFLKISWPALSACQISKRCHKVHDSDIFLPRYKVANQYWPVEFLWSFANAGPCTWNVLPNLLYLTDNNMGLGTCWMHTCLTSVRCHVEICLLIYLQQWGSPPAYISNNILIYILIITLHYWIFHSLQKQQLQYSRK